MQEKGFIYFDDGIGLDEQTKIQGITPYVAFFSIGKSTKIQGESIGYKCQGSKLCFASNKITVITRCQSDLFWRYKSIDNPKNNINEKFNIASEYSEAPWELLNEIIQKPKASTKKILDSLDQSFFNSQFKPQGTMIIVQGLEVERFSDYYSSDDYKEEKWSYLKYYIRYNTKHGDMRILRADKTGFPQRREISFKNTLGYTEDCKLYLWSRSTKQNYELEEIPCGYPYLEAPDENEKKKIKSPSEISRLNDGNFSTRHCSTFMYEDITYCVVLAIDGNRRALREYKELSRKGKSQSGIKLSDQRGVFISSEGVRICLYNEIFENNVLKEYSILKDSKALPHYLLIINGSFDVVTNRNSLTDSSRQILNNPGFLENIKKFLDSAKKDSTVFSEFIERLNKENQEAKLEAYTQKLIFLKQNIQTRKRFKIENITELKNKWIVEPEVGEEHWVGALYTMFAHLVTDNSPYAEFWLRPRTFSGVGLDSIAVPLQENSLAEKVHRGLEYKYSFSATDEYNHPFIVTNCIVCWEMPMPEEGDSITDAYDYFGEVGRPEGLLKDVGYEIIKIQSKLGEIHNGNIQVISLKKLLDKTFQCDWITPPD